METVEFKSLPEIKFAHVYSAPTYHANFSCPEKNLEITYISEGELLRTEGPAQFFCRKGDVMCSFYDKPTSIIASAFHEHHTLSVHVDWTRVPNHISGLLLPPVTPAELHTQKACGLIDAIIHRKHQYMESAVQGAAKVLELVCEIDRCNRNYRQDFPSEILYTQRAKEFIHKHIQQPITQRAVAEHLSITPEYLCAVFKKSEGVTLMKYINSVKMKTMASLMERENVRLYEAAAMFGYADPNYVSRLFKQYFGYNITDKSKNPR